MAHRRIAFPPPLPPRHLLFGLILLATWFRLWRLDIIPPGLWFDEAYNGMDAIWMSETNGWTVFLPGNHGREALYHYLLIPSILVLGQTAYAIRFTSALLGVLTIPLMYRWTATLFGDEADRRWLALIGTTGLLTSLWFLIMNRTGYRANLLPLFVCFVSYFFWRGWQTGKIRFYLLAGLGLGLSQYTYTSARLFPAVFVLFAAVQTALLWRDGPARLKTLWLGLIAMGLGSLLVAAPLLLFALQQPDVFWGRTADVAVKVGWSLDELQVLGRHLGQAVRVFIDGQDPNWRHHLPGRPGFNGVAAVGFWSGLLVVIRRARRPAYGFLLILLFVMWLPAPLSTPPFHTLRLAGVLPAYYAIVAVGLLTLANLVGKRLPRRPAPGQTGLVVWSGLLLIGGSLTYDHYFHRWAKAPQLYQAFDGPVVELATQLASNSADNVVIPFYLYGHASLRYLLHDDFTEEILLSDDPPVVFQEESLSLIAPTYPADDGQPPAFVWFRKTGDSEPGAAYVSGVNRAMPLNRLATGPSQAVKGANGQTIGRRYTISREDLRPLFFKKLPEKESRVEWAANLRLRNYQFTPQPAEAGDTIYLELAWETLGHTGLEEKMFLQLLDSRGRAVGQQEVKPISKKMYRWRPAGLVLEQHLIPLAPDLRAGLYFIRLGFFEPQSGRRLPAYTHDDNHRLGDEVIIGPLYVRAEGIDPARPRYPMQAAVGDQFELLGYTIYPAETEETTVVELYWQTKAPVETDYTVFVQLLDRRRQVIAQVDAQPLAGLYPTSRWQPDDIISDRFVLPVAAHELSTGDHSLVAGMYDLSTGVRLPVYNDRGEQLPNRMIVLNSSGIDVYR